MANQFLNRTSPRILCSLQVNSVFNQEVSKRVGSTNGNGWIAMKKIVYIAIRVVWQSS